MEPKYAVDFTAGLTHTALVSSSLGLRRETASRIVRSRWPFGRPHTENYSFDDWTVDGVPLRDLVGASPLGQHPAVTSIAEVTHLVDGSADAVKHVDQHLGTTPTDFDGGRIALLICSFDWAVECGALSAGLAIESDTVQWQNLGWQHLCEPSIEFVEPALTITFDRPAYEQVLREARQRHGVLAAGARSTRRTGATWG